MYIHDLLNEFFEKYDGYALKFFTHMETISTEF